MQNCVGQSQCVITNVHDYINVGGNGEGCSLTEVDSLFIQYNCRVSAAELSEKREQGLIAACVNIFAALTLLAVLSYRQASISIEKKEWDLQTVTASDYCLEIKLSENQVNQMRRDIYSNSFEYYESDGYQIKFWLKKILEDQLT